MLLVVTNKGDLACDFLILRLKERGIDFLRLNTEDYGKKYEFDLSVSQHGPTLTVTFGNGTQITNSNIHAVYFRQPLLPTPNPRSRHKTSILRHGRYENNSAPFGALSTNKNGSIILVTYGWLLTK